MPHGDVARAISEAPEPLRSWFLLAFRAGLRCCEIAPIRTSDIQAGMLVISEQKGGSMGVVPVSPGLLAAMAPNLHTPGWWFPHGEDPARHVTATQVSKRGNRWLHEHEIGHTMHSLRHRFITDMYVLSGYDLLLTAELGRHLNLNSTRGYTQLAPQRAASVVELADTHGTAA
jgi:integrase